MNENHGLIQVIDSHTGGEPTRTVIAGGPDLGGGSLAEQRSVFQQRFDRFRSAVVNEPRGSDVLVGAFLTPSPKPECIAGVIFFNNVGTLGMCGHGTIGVAVTLARMGKIGIGSYLLDTPVGTVGFDYLGEGQVAIDNVPSNRYRKSCLVDVPGLGSIRGDVAWGGNWFFLTDHIGPELTLANVEPLTDIAWRIRQALQDAGITGRDGALIDHIELFGPPADPANHSRSFVLCPGKAYDRSPCGTGTSAKLACLYEDDKLAPGAIWRQESIIGSVFEGSVQIRDGQIIPRIRGQAFVCSEATLIFDPADPFRDGIR